MEVKLIAYTQPVECVKQSNPLSIVEECAAVCYDSKPTESYRIAKACMDSGHQSPFEHISFTFHISGVSRSLMAQLSRHRHISLSVRSQRYCKEGNFDFVTPAKFIDAEEELETEQVFNEAMGNARWYYETLVENCFANPEDARAVLPNACCTELYMTANARALIEMSHLRLCNRAEQEIRNMFEALKEQVSIVAPEIADYMRPKCEINKDYPFCTEKKCCGKHKTLKEVYKNEQ